MVLATKSKREITNWVGRAAGHEDPGRAARAAPGRWWMLTAPHQLAPARPGPARPGPGLGVRRSTGGGRRGGPVAGREPCGAARSGTRNVHTTPVRVEHASLVLQICLHRQRCVSLLVLVDPFCYWPASSLLGSQPRTVSQSHSLPERVLAPCRLRALAPARRPALRPHGAGRCDCGA